MYRYIFGPVPSRRLGMSLGIDLIPKKFCSLDCVYCEVGKTTRLTVEPKEYVKTYKILEELDDFMDKNPNPDVITFSGSGEPTLNIAMENVIDHIKEKYPKIPIAVLTNGTLLTNKKIRKVLTKVDIVLPSLDAVTDKVFKKINRPHAELDIQKCIEGLIEFRKEYKGKIWLEVFILPGYNDFEEELNALKNTILKINPTLVQLNTLDRPGTVNNLRPASQELLERIAKEWFPLNVEIVARYASRKSHSAYNIDIESSILKTISRRPSTLEDLNMITGVNINELNKYLSQLEKDGKIQTEVLPRGVFYKPKSD